MLSKRLLQLLLLASCCSLATIHGEDINLVADVYMPYTGDSGKGETGFMIDIAKAIFEKDGYKVNYETKAWKEALDATSRGEATAIVGANRDDAPGFLYPSTPEAKAQGTFYTLSSSSWKYAGPDSLSKVCFGIISDYKYNPEIALYIKKNRSNNRAVRAVESSPEILNKFFDYLDAKQIDTFVEDKYVVQYFLKSFDRADKFGEAGDLKNSTSLYIAVSPSALDGDVIVKQLNEGMAEIRTNGTLKTILAKYGLEDWQK